MRTKVAVLAFVVIIVYAFAVARARHAPPYDLRDAVADNGAGLAAAGPGHVWKHVSFQAADMTVINIDYAVASQEPDQNAGDGVVAYAVPMWINVINPAYNGTEKVSVTIMEPTGWQPVDIDLEYVEDVGGKRFTGRSGQRIALVGRSSGVDYSKKIKELSVLVNGVSLTDPVSDSKNFKFRMSWD